jgi:hypothetical protein
MGGMNGSAPEKSTALLDHLSEKMIFGLS